MEIERLAAIRREKIVMGAVEFEKVTTPEPDQQTLSFVNILANSSGLNKRMRGTNVIGGSIIIIERLRRSFRIILGKWSHFC
jgi:hypothetical protein